MEMYKQNTYETCFPSCLIALCGLPRNEENEVEIWKHGWKFDYYVLGQLNYVAEKFGKKFRVYVESEPYYNQIKKIAGPKVELINQRVDLKLIKSKVINHPVIIYLDEFALHKYNHVPHFVIIDSLNEDGSFKVGEPYEGKYLNYSAEAISEGIKLLWNHIMNTRFLIEEGE